MISPQTVVIEGRQILGKWILSVLCLCMLLLFFYSLYGSKRRHYFSHSTLASVLSVYISFVCRQYTNYSKRLRHLFPCLVRTDHPMHRPTTARSTTAPWDDTSARSCCVVRGATWCDTATPAMDSTHSV